MDSLSSVNRIFNLLIAVIGLISLIIVFFVLLIATTANIKENVWEYGVLRSVGLTKAEGQRVFMYEAFLVISAASILGVSIGVIVTALVTQQFYTFVELPFKLSLPYFIILSLLVTALLTTYFAVLIPIRKVNQYNIAKVLKSGS
jgi:ABC-type antimicrobial peptide transport system permease subunit